VTKPGSIAQKVGREPHPNFHWLREYEATWRRFGAPSLELVAWGKVTQYD
jgi:hypothetical protein